MARRGVLRDLFRRWRIQQGMSRFRDIELDSGVIRRLKKGDRKAQEIVYRAFRVPCSPWRGGCCAIPVLRKR